MRKRSAVSELNPAVVGDVLPGSPAAKAGLQAGDEIIEIDGESRDIDFSNIGIAAALSAEDEAIPVKVRRRDGSEEEIEMVAEQYEAIWAELMPLTHQAFVDNGRVAP